MTINLPTLHAAGADVAGEHGEAWLRLSRPVRVADIRSLHERLGRPVFPCDLTGQPMPEHHSERGPRAMTPGQAAYRSVGPLDPDMLYKLIEMIAANGCKATARRAGISSANLERIRRGGDMTADTRRRIEATIRAASGETRKFGK